MQLLAAAQVERVAEYIEVGFKIGDGVFIRIVVIDTQAASYIDVLYLDIPFHQIVLQAVDAFAEYPESLHVQDLRSDMKVEADKLYMRIALQLGKYAIEHLDGNTEFVFTQARRDVLVGMCVDIGVQPQGNRGYRLFFAGQLFDDGQLFGRLYIEAEYFVIERVLDFPVGLSYAGEYNLSGRESSLQSGLYLAAAYAVGPYSRSGNQSQYLGIGIGFDGIVYLKIPFFGQAGKCRECIVQQRLIVIIKRSFFLIEMSNRKHVSQKVKCHAEHILHDTVL